MELDITDFFNNAAPMDYSASVAEIGRNAGPDTWRAANEDSGDYPLLDTDEKRAAFRSHVKEFGAWDAAEIAAWSDTALNALCMQFIAGCIRESKLDAASTAEDWEAHYANDSQSGRLFRDEADRRVYYYLGS